VLELAGLPKLSVRLHGGLEPQHCIALAKAADAHARMERSEHIGKIVLTL